MSASDAPLLEKALQSHPAVAEAAVRTSLDSLGVELTTAYVHVNEAGLESAGVNRERLSSVHVSNWTALYDHVYTQPSDMQELFDTRGWRSAFTGAAIPEVEMREWVDHTVERIVAKRPRRVLEIGCGTGLLLLRLAPLCEAYVGTDVSQPVLDQLERFLDGDSRWFHVRLLRRSADDVRGLDLGAFDTIVINSVAQYFPSIDYLSRLLARVVRAMPSGSVLFIGDVRCLRLLRIQHLSILASRGVAKDSVMDALKRRLDSENELAIDPDFFHSLRAEIPRISDVEVFLKRGWRSNELTRFRYDVFLHVEAGKEDGAPPPECCDWHEDVSTLQGLRDLLRSRPVALEIRAIPNARLAEGLALLEEIEGRVERHDLSSPMSEIGVEPEALWDVSTQSGYRLELGYDRGRSLGLMEALLRPINSDASRVFWSQAAAPDHGHSPRSYSNDPLSQQMKLELVASLRRYLRDNFPALAVPQRFVVLKGLRGRESLAWPRADPISTFSDNRLA